MRHWRITGNSHAAVKTESYIFDSMIDITAISTPNLGFFDYPQCEEIEPGRLRRRPTTGNGNVAIKAGNTCISGTVTDRMTIPTANLGFSTTPSATKLTRGDCNNYRQLKIVIWAFCLLISPFLAGCCRNHLANPLLSSKSSQIPNLAWELRRYLSQFRRCNYFGFWEPYQHFQLSVTVVLTYQHYFTPVLCLIYFNVVGILSVPFVA